MQVIFTNFQTNSTAPSPTNFRKCFYVLVLTITTRAANKPEFNFPEFSVHILSEERSRGWSESYAFTTAGRFPEHSG